MAAVAARASETLAEKLLESYEQVRTVSGESRKTSRGGDSSMQLLSRIFFERPDRIHIENVSPVRRRIVADGRRLYYHEAGAIRGFSRPIEALTDTWVTSLRTVPASPGRHLAQLQGIPEQRLEPTPEHPHRAGYQSERVYAVLACDEQMRPRLLDVFESSNMTTRVARYTFDRFYAVSTNCWLPQLHRGELYLPDGTTATEVHRFSNLAVNEPIPEGLFSPDVFFEGVTFTNDFEATYTP